MSTWLMTSNSHSREICSGSRGMSSSAEGPTDLPPQGEVGDGAGDGEAEDGGVSMVYLRPTEEGIDEVTLRRSKLLEGGQRTREQSPRSCRPAPTARREIQEGRSLSQIVARYDRPPTALDTKYCS